MRPTRAQMLSGGSGAYGAYDSIPYDAADIYGEHMAGWRPFLWSPDGELNVYRDRIVARMRDIVRNDGWASGAITRILDNAIGANFRPIFKPDYRALCAYTGLKAFDAKWADEFGRVAESNWRTWAEDIGRYCDAQRKNTVAQIMHLAFRHKLIDGDALAMLPWLPNRGGRYATCIQLIDPDRLSNPQIQFDTQVMRGGVRLDDYGVATGYYIRQAHFGDWWAAQKSLHWDLVPRETKWGRPIIVHDFDSDRADQHRGGAGVLTPVLQRLKMLVKYDGTELDTAILNAIFGAYVESPFDPQLVAEALDGGERNDELDWYQQQRSDFHKDRRLMLGNSRIPILFPGEKIGMVNAERPNSNFPYFENAVLRNVAAGVGLSAQQISNNWSDVNYSSARGALLEAWKTLHVRRTNFASGFAMPISAAFLEESMDVDDYPLPKGAPAFMECRTAYARCKWMGPGRGWIDPVSEKQGSVLGMTAGLSTLEDECAENSGLDWEENLDQRKREVEAFKERGLELPTWAQVAGMGNATQIADKPPVEKVERPEA
jgi:lambda family phage portal protein